MRTAALVLLVAMSACGDAAASGPTVSDAPAGSVPSVTAPLAPSTSTMNTQRDPDDGSADEADGVHTAEHGVGHGKSQAEAGADRDVEVVMTEYAFEPATFVVSAGETVTFHILNEGEQEHEFRLTTAEFAEHHISEGHSDHHDDEPGVLLLDPGQEGRLTITFEVAGQYDVVACLLPDHYELGMVAPLEVGDLADG